MPPSNILLRVERRANEIWLNEGGGHGCDLDHWLRAEGELAAARLADND